MRVLVCFHVEFICEMCHREQTRHAIWARVFIFIFLILVWQAILIKPLPHNIESVESWCQIPEPIPVLDHGHGLRPSSDFSTNAAIQIQVKRLSSAVRVATESWDDNGDVDVDPRWRAFETFHAVLKSLFPKVYGRMELHVLYGFYSSRLLGISLPSSTSHIVTASSTP